VAAVGQTKRAAAPIQGNPELLGLEKKCTNKKFTDAAEKTKGSKKASAQAEGSSSASLSSSGRRLGGSLRSSTRKTKLPNRKKRMRARSKKVAPEYYIFECLNSMLDTPPYSNESDYE
jgi:hypothetical protein